MKKPAKKEYFLDPKPPYMRITLYRRRPSLSVDCTLGWEDLKLSPEDFMARFMEPATRILLAANKRRARKAK